MAIVIDPSSLANLDEVRTNHIHLNWTISFDQKKIGGNVILDIVTLVDNVEKVVLDTSYLDLQAVSINGEALQVKSLSVKKKKVRAYLY